MLGAMKNCTTNRDYHWGTVVALLDGDGDNESTTMVDSSPLAANWTAVGNAKLTTAEKKFGTAAIAFDGSGDYIYPSAASSNFAYTTDFTVEMWVRVTNVSSPRVLYDGRSSGGSELVPVLYINTGGALRFYAAGNDRIIGAALATNTWYHVALCRAAGVTRLFQDGSVLGSYSDGNSYVEVANRPRIGADNSGTNGFIGQIDGARISKFARYTGGFTAPTEPFPSRG